MGIANAFPSLLFCLKNVPSPRGRVVVVLETVSKATTTGGGIINYLVLTKIEHHSRHERFLASVKVQALPAASILSTTVRL